MSDKSLPLAPLPELTGPPRYDRAPVKVHEEAVRRFTLTETLDGVFVVAAAGSAVWLAWILLLAGVAWSPTRLPYLIAFWGLLTYVALPRIHAILTKVYVPDYFIGRTRTSDGLLGDPVNLAFLGDAKSIHTAMIAAGWRRADDISLRSTVKIILSWFLRRSYEDAPVSPLMLFGKPQAFAYQQEVKGNPSRRHHVRFWPCPEGWLLPGGYRVDWLAAGTYDRAVGLSLFTLQVTHKIDANIDIERDYIVDTLRWFDPDTEVRVVRDFSTAYHSRNGGGDRINTDGNLLVVVPDPPGEEPETGTAVRGAMKMLARDRIRRQGRPPASLILTSVLVALNTLAILAGAIWISFAPDAELRRVLDEVGVPAAVVGLVALGIGSIPAGLMWLTLLGYQRARVGLLGVLTFLTIATLAQASATPPDNFGPGSFLNTGLTLLAVMSATSDASRQWVREKGSARRTRRGQPEEL